MSYVPTNGDRVKIIGGPAVFINHLATVSNVLKVTREVILDVDFPGAPVPKRRYRWDQITPHSG